MSAAAKAREPDGLSERFKEHADEAVTWGVLGPSFEYLIERIAELYREQDRLKAQVKTLEARPVMHDAGVWTDGKAYEEGSIVSHRGAAWVCREAHYAVGTDIDHERFRLLVKRGADGKNGKDGRLLR